MGFVLGAVGDLVRLVCSTLVSRAHGGERKDTLTWEVRRVNNLAVIETILRNRRRFFLEIRSGMELHAKIRAMLVSGIVFLALYGMVMGSTHSLWQVFSSAVKLPLLFLSTLIITLPTLYFFNLIFGSNQSLTQNFCLVLTAITVTAVLLLSFAPIVMFFAQRGCVCYFGHSGGAFPVPGNAARLGRA
jgi:hypothetical protein